MDIYTKGDNTWVAEVVTVVVALVCLDKILLLQFSQLTLSGNLL